MKNIGKIAISAALAVSMSQAISIGGLELSPEVGGGFQSSSYNGESHYDWNLFARVWFGVGSLMVAPQFRYTSQDSFSNTQVGANVGYKFDLTALSLTPYVGASYSKYSDIFDDSIAYNAGVRVKPLILPLFVGVEYEYQKPDLLPGYIGGAQKMDAVRFTVGFSF